MVTCGALPLQSAQAAEGFVGSPAEGCGSHLLHQLFGRGRGEAAEDHPGEGLSFSLSFSSPSAPMATSCQTRPRESLDLVAELVLPVSSVVAALGEKRLL